MARPPGTCPLGSGAGAGTTFPIDPEMTARELGFDGPAPNSLAATASRQEATAFAAASAGCAVTLSRLGADLVLWTSREFGFARLGDGRQRRTVVELRSQQCMNWYVASSGDRIEAGHLQSCTERIVPHDLCSIFSFGSGDSFIAGRSPSVIQQRFAIATLTRL